jgi:capsular exopolysaccharide synthesis family protein
MNSYLVKNTIEDKKAAFSQEVILVDLKKWLDKLLSYWWLFLICLALAYFGGKLYLRYATYEYAARAILLIKDTGNSGGISEQSVLLTDQSLLNGTKAMDNEIQILRSLTLMEKVVDRLDIEVSYFRKGNIKEAELYHESPFLLDSYVLKSELEFGLTFYLDIKDYDGFELKFDEEAESGIRYSYGVPFENEYGRFLISYNSTEAIIPGQYRMTIVPVEYAARDYSSKLQIIRIGDQSASSVLELSLIDPVGRKCSDILNTLIDVYNEEEVRDENKVLRNTLEFIDKRVANLLVELDSIEGGVENFKSANAIITDNASSSLNFTLDEMRASVQELSQYEIQQELLRSLENLLTDRKKAFELIPANLIGETPALSGLVDQYNDLVLRRNTMMATASEINPSRIALENEIVNIRGLILETMQNLQKDLRIPMEKLERTIEDLRRSTSTIPGVEKRLVEKMRTQSIKENLFLFLLQKREETALSEAIATAKTRTIDHARTPKYPIYPRRQLIMFSCLLLGVILPTLFVTLRSFFEVKVNSEETIKSLTTIPVLGRIAQSKDKTPIVVKMGSRSAINEMFRLLRANLNFMSPDQEKQVYMVTSSISGEGKTFVALNLAIALALSQKKVIVLGMDLRKPKLGPILGASATDAGISNFLIGQATLPEVIRTYESIPNLHYISSGAVPPNPTELLGSARMDQLFTALSKQYDYILIDTPPVSLVSDALLLRKYVSSVLVVVRHNYTKKNMLKTLEELYENGELEGASLVYNGIKYGKRYGYSNGYYYGYGQGYYIDEEKDA